MPLDTPALQRLLRAAFDARVFNHGDYNLVYGQPSGGVPLVIGYRHAPLEMLLCPVDAGAAVSAGVADEGAAREAAGKPAADAGPVDEVETGADGDDAAEAQTDVVDVGLSNVATVADTGTGYQVETVTGFRTWFEVVEHPRVPVGEASEDGVAVLDQAEDAADFHAFMTAFMDELDRLYEVPPETPADGAAGADLHRPPEGV